MYANLAMELDLAKYLIEKAIKPCDKRRIVGELRNERPKDISKACRLIHLSRSSLLYKSVKDDNTLIGALQELAVKNPQEGFWKCYGRIRNQGEVVNHKRLHRVYKQIGMPLRRKVKNGCLHELKSRWPYLPVLRKPGVLIL